MRVSAEVTMWSRYSGKTSMLQPFLENDVKRWKTYTEHQSEQVVSLFLAVWNGATSHTQLANMKKLSGMIAHQPVSSTYLLLVLIEMHAASLSRHPLQRTISSQYSMMISHMTDYAACVQRAANILCEAVMANIHLSLPELYSETVTDHVHSTIDTVLGSDWHATHTQRLQYLEALTENFALGELALLKQLPLVIQYCVSVIDSCHSKHKLMDPLFIIVLKITMSILHKTQSLLCDLLSGRTISSSNIEITWPKEIRVESTEFKVQWVRGLLQTAKRICEEILQTDVGVPHDLTLTAAMLYIVIILRTSNVEDNLDANLSTITANWLYKTGSPLNYFSRLSLCHALLAKLPPSSILVTTGGKPCLLNLFPIICQLLDSFTETSDRYIAARTVGLWTTVAKQCAGVIEEGDCVYKALLPSGHVIRTVLKYVWALWEDPVDGIRHQCNLMFENVIGICQQLQITGSHCRSTVSSSPSPFLLSLTDSLLSLSSPTRGKYQLLSTLSHHLPITTLLSTAPNLPTELLSVMGHQALACHAGELWSRLVQMHWNEDKVLVTVWSKTWVDTVVDFMLSASPLARQHTIQHCLPCLFECSDDCMNLIQTTLKKNTTASADDILTTELACLRCAKSHLTDFVWEKCHESTFIAATHHKDEQIQLSALGILCESHRSTEPPPPNSLPLLLTFLSLNGCTQSPNIRYPIITAVKKLLIRIRDSSYAMRKLYSKKRGPDPQSTITSYQEFLHNLTTQQFVSLNPFSSYQRRHMALSVLQLVSTIFPSSPPKSSTTSFIGVIYQFPSEISINQVRRLVYCLRDSYDANRALVIDLLYNLPQESVGLVDAKFVNYLVTSFYQFVCSPKAVDCTTASYILRLLLYVQCTQFHHLLHEHLVGSQHLPTLHNDSLLSSMGTIDLPPHWSILSLLLSLLQSQLDRARDDLLTASIQSPLYGVIQSVRATLEEAKKLSCDLKVCRMAMSKIIQLCCEVADLSSPVVCNSSPEGFLPGSKGLPVSSSSTTVTVSGASAQSLLLCCWHAMKETSLLMGLVIEWAPLGDSSTDSLLTHNQVNSIAGVFIHQLTEARHRGAFEMAYSGFQKLCQSLWNSTCLDFQLMPSQWVKELLNSLQSKSMSRLLSITRRSAGLPFYLQAILTTEPSHTGRPCLKLAMRSLLSVASVWRQPDFVPKPTVSELEDGIHKPVTDPNHDHNVIQSHSAAVHALNILRALYRDSRLGEQVIPFIPEGVEIAVHGFSASLWPVRNSSTLLFSSLVLRIFGAKRVQDEHSIENKMTAREFFTRFPTLHDFLLQQLQQAASELKACETSENDLKSLQLSLFPVLLILSRLYPTALDESNSPTSLQSFLPLLLQCSSCAVWKTRVLISRAVVPLINPHNVQTILDSVLQNMTISDQNSLHTALLIVNRLVQERSELLEVTSESTKLIGEELLDNLLRMKKIVFDQNQCSITRSTYLDLVTNILEYLAVKKQPSLLEVAEQLFQEMKISLVDCMKGDWSLQQENVSLSMSKLLFTCAIGLKSTNNISQTYELFSECIEHESVAIRQHTVQYIMNNDALVLSQTGGELIKLFVRRFTTEIDETVLSLVSDVLAKLTKSGYLNIGEDLWISALECASKQYLRLELRTSLLLFLSSMIEKSYDHTHVMKWLSLVEHYTHPTAPVELRQAVAIGLGNLWKILLQVDSFQSVETYCLLVVGLLQDGDEEVRNDMADSIGTLLSSLSSYVENACVLATSSHLSASSALNSYIQSLPLLLHNHPQITHTILLHLLHFDTILVDIKSSGSSTNLLFEEDPLNNYMEEMNVLTVVCGAMKTLVACHCDQLHQPLISLIQQLYDVGRALLVEANFQESSSEDGHVLCGFSPWDCPVLFLGLCKVTLVSEAVVDGLAGTISPCYHEYIKQLRHFTKLKSALCIV